MTIVVLKDGEGETKEGYLTGEVTVGPVEDIDATSRVVIEIGRLGGGSDILRIKLDRGEVKGLWDKLTGIVGHEIIKGTVYAALREYNEKMKEEGVKK